MNNTEFQENLTLEMHNKLYKELDEKPNEKLNGTLNREFCDVLWLELCTEFDFKINQQIVDEQHNNR